MMDLFGNIVAGIFLLSLAVAFSVGAIISVVMGFCFLREYVHEANERWMQIRKNDDDD